MNIDYKVTVTSATPIDISITLIPNDPTKINVINGTSLIIPKGANPLSVTYILNANTPGIYYIHYEINPSHNILMPNDSIIFVQPNDPLNDRVSYFDVLNMEEGFLVPGCCKLSVIENVCHTDLTFQSSCQWTMFNDDKWISNGVVFVSNSLVSLPLSINGLSIESTTNTFQYYLSPNYQSFPRECLSCNKTSYDCQSIDSSISFELQDIELFLKSQSLTNTFASLMVSFIPEWLSVAILPKNGMDESYSDYDYFSLLLSKKEIMLIDDCHSAIPSDKGHLYYVLRTQTTLHLQINSYSRHFVYANASKPHCIAVDMCNAISPLFYYAIPNELQPSQLTTIDYFQNILADKGKLIFNRIVFGKGGIVKNLDNSLKYWNGNDYKTPLIGFAI